MIRGVGICYQIEGVILWSGSLFSAGSMSMASTFDPAMLANRTACGAALGWLLVASLRLMIN